MKIPIYVQENNEELNDKLGLELQSELQITVLHVLDEHVIGFWRSIDGCEITIYTTVGTFCAPYSVKLINELSNILKSN